MTIPLPARELERLEILSSYQVLDTPADPRIDVFVRLASQIYDVPVSFVSLVDEHRVWFKARAGDDHTQVPREIGFCAHAILRPDDVMVVEDLRCDPRFAANPLVWGPPNIRFYAGAPVVSAEGLAIGTLCILDHKPRTLGEPYRRRLADLALGVGAALDLHRSAVQLLRAALHDPLTGLANRAKFDPELDDAVRSAQTGVPCAVLMLDIDRFKSINDRFGHSTGDAVLRVTAARLRRAARHDDVVARFGGDEFAVLIRGPMEAGSARFLAQRILSAFSEPVIIGGQSISVTTSVGFAVAPNDADDAAALIRSADRALYRAKDVGRGVAVAASDAPAQPVPLPSIVADLRDAVASGGFTLVWQPYFETLTGRVEGCEALLRWCRPGYGDVAPTAFISIAEGAGLMSQIDAWVLHNACATAAMWQLPLAVSLNVTPTTFCMPDFAERVSDVLGRAGLEPSRLILEVTERMAMDSPELARRRIEELHAIGVRVALDDFGTGYSALAALKEFAFDKLKLDRTFTQDLGRDRRSDAVARAVIELGHATGMTVCAEGVETDGQLAFLRAHGCELAQGFLLGRPAKVAPMRDFRGRRVNRP